jgi:Rieske Fe-S protein
MEDFNQISLTRRKMIRTLGWLVIIPLAGLWDFMIERNQSRREGVTIKMLLGEIPVGRSYSKDYFINRHSEKIEVFSLRCTHLGCRLKPSDDGHLICPCHGSAFDPDSGAVTKGPAAMPLQMLESKIEGNHLIISLS